MNYLIHPLTQEKISIYSKKAIGVLKKYVSQYIKNMVGGMDSEEEEFINSLPPVPPTNTPNESEEETNNIVELSLLLDFFQDNNLTERSKEIVKLYLLELDIMFEGVADVTFDKTYDAFYDKLKAYRLKREEEDNYNYENTIDFIENSYNFPDDIDKFKKDVLDFQIDNVSLSS